MATIQKIGLHESDVARQLRAMAEQLRSIAQNEYMGASGGYYGDGIILQHCADVLEEVAGRC